MDADRAVDKNFWPLLSQFGNVKQKKVVIDNVVALA